MQNIKLIFLMLFFSKCHFIIGSYSSTNFIKKAALEALGLPDTANGDDIKRAYRKLSLIHHSDKHQLDDDKKKEEHEEIFKKIATAYNCLTDPTKCDDFASTYLKESFQQTSNTYEETTEDYSIKIGQEILRLIDNYFQKLISLNLSTALNGYKYAAQTANKNWDEHVVNILKTITIAFDIIPEFKTAPPKERLFIAKELKKFATQEHDIYKNNQDISSGIAEILKKIDLYLATLDKEVQDANQKSQRKLEAERNRQAQAENQRKLEAERGEQKRVEQIRNSRAVNNASKKNTNLPNYRESSQIKQSQTIQKNQLSESLSNFVKSLKNLTEILQKQRAGHRSWSQLRDYQ